jgi:hypothetical protein
MRLNPEPRKADISFPNLPASFVNNPPELLKALAAAVRSATQEHWFELRLTEK